jgi:hypothetical protein
MFAKLVIALIALAVTGTIIAQQPAPSRSGHQAHAPAKVEVPGTNYEANHRCTRSPAA